MSLSTCDGTFAHVCVVSIRPPFTKDAVVSTLFTSNDFNQMTNRLEFIIRSRGIGVFLSNPGMGKTTCLRKALESLNPNRYVVIYICMTTITAIDFYRMLNNELGLEETTKLKADNALEWVGRMNNIQACAREIVDKEMIYQ